MRFIMNSTLALVFAAMVAAGTASAAEQPKSAAPAGLSLERTKTAVLIMDFENDIVNLIPEKDRQPLLDKAGRILAGARKAGMQVIYIVVRFRDGYPEISPRNKLFAGVKELGWLREGTPGAEIHPAVAPKPGDIVVTKRRVGAFSTTDLETILRSKGIDTLAMFGIATSGVVLSTVRDGFDRDYRLVVIGDACADRSEEVHRALVEKIFPGQASVVSTQEFLDAVGH